MTWDVGQLFNNLVGSSHVRQMWMGLPSAGVQTMKGPGPAEYLVVDLLS